MRSEVFRNLLPLGVVFFGVTMSRRFRPFEFVETVFDWHSP